MFTLALARNLRDFAAMSLPAMKLKRLPWGLPTTCIIFATAN